MKTILSPIPSIKKTIFFFLLLFSLTLHLCSSQSGDDLGNEGLFNQCGLRYDCGHLTNISYPFWGNYRNPICGHPGFELSCLNNESTTIKMADQSEFRVLNIDQLSKIMTIARTDLFDNLCPQIPTNTTIDYSLFNYTETARNLSVFYRCTIGRQFNQEIVIGNFTCPPNGGSGAFINLYGFEDQLLAGCENPIQVTISRIDEEKMDDNGEEALREAIREGFNVSYQNYTNTACNICESSGGQCGFQSSFFCVCPNGEIQIPCLPIPRAATRNVPRKVAIGLGSGFGGIVLMVIVFFIWLRYKKKKYVPSALLSRSFSSDPSSSVYELEKGVSHLGIHLFTYNELEEATNKFDPSKELGDGGFGTVYYGVLQDGRTVAVKRLYENNYKRVGQFMNEVEILTRLRHPNLVSLYGCTSRHSRELLLVYEYVPNGTIADHLHGERMKPGKLPWPTRMKIAIETADALVYLHASDIIHRDVKTNNILLDDNFSIKVADFGLSRLFPMDVTHVSTAPQGTPGYVDPEYHQCYQLTDKSDVYSFGVVLVELISSLPAVDITRHRHEINLSNMAINRIQNHALNELVDQSLGFDSDFKTRDMISAVAELAFRCLQNVKEDRPSMVEVLEILKSIQTENYNKDKAEEIDISADDLVLLKHSSTLELSPKSVSARWISTASTPNTSG